MKGLAVFLCLCIVFLPAIVNAGAGTKIGGFYKDLLPPLPKPELPDAAETQSKIDLTVAAKPKPSEAASPGHEVTAVRSLAANVPPVSAPEPLNTEL